MKEVIDEYGSVIVFVLVTVVCLTTFCNIWFNSGSFISDAATNLFNSSTSNQTVTSTTDNIQGGETQQDTAKLTESIKKRREPMLYSDDSQLVINTPYASNSFFYAVDADGSRITTENTSNNGYFRILSISQANGNVLISDCANLNSISYEHITYPDKKGGAGRSSYVNSTQKIFYINAPDNTSWLTYNMSNKNWTFYKAGVYCFKVFICDSKGKSTISTAYININK